MKSIKRGRGPSLMDGAVEIVVAVIGVIWTISAMSMGASWMFAAFGVAFVLIAAGNAAYHFVNATGKRRFSEYDVTTDDEEADPLNEYFGERETPKAPKESKEERAEYAFCPYCGTERGEGDRYCRKCGKQVG